MNQIIAWRSTGFSVAHYSDAGVRWRESLIFYEDSDFSFFNARNKTTDNFPVVGYLLYIICFFSAQHFDTCPSNKGDEHINATHGGRQPYTADTVNNR